MSTTIFPTYHEALAAGYTKVRRDQHIATVDGYDIRVIDTSPAHSYGYSFAVAYWGGRDWVRTAETVSVLLTEQRNRAGQVPSVETMFPPGAYERGIAAAREGVRNLHLGEDEV